MIVAASFAATAPLSAQLMFTADLTGGQQPGTPVNSTGQGTGWVILEADMQTIRYEVSVAMLNTSPNPASISGAHIHMAPAGVNGDVYETINFGTNGRTASGTITNAPDSIVAKLLKGELYFNIHSPNFPSGELRGQILQSVGIPFKVSMNSSQQVPTLTANAKGTGWAVLDSTGNTLTYQFTMSGLTGAPTSGHIHAGAAGANGAVIHTLTLADSTTQGQMTGLTETNVASLIKDGLYFNIHTAANANGELRGQILRSSKIMVSGILNGANHVPAVTTNGKATFFGVLDPSTATLSYQLTYAQFNSGAQATAAHFHYGAAGVSGGVAETINLTGNTTAATWTAIPDSSMAKLVRRSFYINIHSTLHAGGEVRGQVTSRWGAFATINLTGAQQNPAVTTNARGTGFATLSGGQFRYWITIAGLGNGFTASHLHNGAMGSNGSVITTLNFTDSTAIGSAAISTDADMVSIIKNRTYVNVHTTANPNGEIRGQVLIQMMNMVTGINRLPNLLQNVSLFPNPAQDVLNLRLENALETPTTVSFFDMSGRMVQSAQQNLQAGENTLDISNLEAGFYMMVLSNEKGLLSTQKFVKQ